MNILSIYCKTDTDKLITLNNMFLFVAVALIVAGLFNMIYGYYRIAKERKRTKESMLNIVRGLAAVIFSIVFFVLFQSKHDKSTIFVLITVFPGTYLSVSGIWQICHSYIYSKEESNTKSILIKGIISLLLGLALIAIGIHYFGTC